MSVATTHPERETLIAFANGRLPEPRHAEVEAHVADCEACCAVLEHADADSLVHLARLAAEDLNTPHPDTASLISPVPDIPAPLRDHPRYQILGKLGEGGMGVVYKAEHRMMGRVVAVKVLNARTTAAAGSADRFRREVRVASRLAHPNIVTAFDADAAGELLFLVMEYIDGISLDQLVSRRGPLPIPMACQFARQTALALQHAHEKGMVHRDIKPHNLMVTRRGQLKVLDFGLARAVQAEGKPASQTAAGMTSPELVVGTPDFLAPEQARNSTTVDIRADIYSLGCTLFFLLTGRTPFPGEHPFEKMIAHVQEPVPDSAVFRPEVPPALTMLVGQLMAKKPEDRLQSPLEVASALATYARPVGPVPAVKVPEKPGVAAFTPTATLPIPAAQIVTPAPVATVITAKPTLEPRDSPARRKPKNTRSRPESESKPESALTRHQHLIFAGLGLLILAPLLAMGIHRLVRTPAPPTDTETIAQSSTSQSVPPDSASTEPPSPPSPVVPSTGFAPLRSGSAHVLLVLPPRDLWLPDLGPLHRVFLNDPRVRLSTASAQAGRVEPHPQCPPPLRTVPAEHALADLDPQQFDAMIFIGAGVDDYVRGGNQEPAVRRLIDAFMQSRKPIAAICVGQKVLGENGYLDTHAAAKSTRYTRNGPRWEDRPVVVSPPFITAGRDQDADNLAHAVLASLGLPPSPGPGRPPMPMPNRGNEPAPGLMRPNPFVQPNPFVPPPKPGFGPRPRPPQGHRPPGNG